VFWRGGTLLAAPFDAASLSVQGAPAPLVEGVRSDASHGIQFAISSDGTLVFVPGGDRGGEDRQLTWVDREGQLTALSISGPFDSLHLVPNTDRVFLGTDITLEDPDIWTAGLTRGDLRRLVSSPEVDAAPLVSNDGQRLVFASNRDGTAALWTTSTDNPEQASKVAEMAFPIAYSWGPDTSVFTTVATEDGFEQRDIVLVDLATGEMTPIVETEADEGMANLSPDGRWLAYSSNATGVVELYVQRFPEGTDRQVVSIGGGTHSRWRADGRELVYTKAPQGPPEAMMRVAFDGSAASGPPSLGIPEQLFPWPFFSQSGGRRFYDITPNAERFLVMSTETGASGRAASPEINVVLNWFEEVNERVPLN